jgi:Na+/H+ antiporter NhaD/arsenite permease-like protein
MIPLIKTVGESSSINLMPLWWALALGACLGGNGTMIGASANVVASDLLKSRGYEISFKDFFSIGFPVMIFSVIVSMVYLIIAYLL